jgi:hypothetical protein
VCDHYSRAKPLRANIDVLVLHAPSGHNVVIGIPACSISCLAKSDFDIMSKDIAHVSSRDFERYLHCDMFRNPLALPGCSIASRRRLRMSALHMMRMNCYSGVATVTFSMLIDGLALVVAVLELGRVSVLKAAKTKR